MAQRKEKQSRTLQQDTLATSPTRERFEAEFAAYTGVKYAFTTSNCTTALYLSMQLLELGPGDEVIVTPQTFLGHSTRVGGSRGRLAFRRYRSEHA